MKSGIHQEGSSALENTEETLTISDENGIQIFRWRSMAGISAPRRVVCVDDRVTADVAYRLASEGTALLWQGDFQNARQLLQAMARRVDQRTVRPKRPSSKKQPDLPLSQSEQFHRYRLAQSQRARTLGKLLIPLTADHIIPLRRAQDVRQACLETYGEAGAPYVISLRELQGIMGAHEWRKQGVSIPALGIQARIHPHYGVFSPLRGEYLDLVAQAALPEILQSHPVAYDVGTGTGVLAAILLQRGVKHVVATDRDARARACAHDNLERLNLISRVEIRDDDLFPPGHAGLIVCNPPWLPGRPATPLDHAIYDPENRMLLGFLRGLPEHLISGGEGWLILSDLAEHLELRTRTFLLDAIAAAGLRVIERLDIRPYHPRMADRQDPLHRARANEVTSLWRLAHADEGLRIGSA